MNPIAPRLVVVVGVAVVLVRFVVGTRGVRGKRQRSC
jgi:hypothetical protein